MVCWLGRHLETCVPHVFSSEYHILATNKAWIFFFLKTLKCDKNSVDFISIFKHWKLFENYQQCLGMVIAYLRNVLKFKGWMNLEVCKAK